MIKLTPKGQESCKSWLYDWVFQPNIPINNPIREPIYNRIGYGGSLSVATTAGKAIYDEIKNRSFANIDSALNKLSGYYFYKDLKNGDITDRSTFHRKPAETLASYIAYFCADNGIFWDDTIRSSYENETFKKTILGQALEQGECFVSQQLNKPAKSQQSTATQSTATKSTTSTGPKNPYKSSGGQSGNVKSLVGLPGQKIDLSQIYPYLYFVKGEYSKIPGKAAFVFTNPLNGQTRCSIKIGSSNGYSDCVLFFATIQEADNCLAQARTLSRVTAGDFVNLEVVKQKVDKNGYFLIETDGGRAYIKASKLNEDINTSAEEDNIKIADIEAFDEAFMKYEY